MQKKVYQLIKKHKKLLVIGHVWPQPNATAAGEHLVHLMRFFNDLKYQLLFVSAAQPPENYTILQELSIDSTSVEINDDGFNDILKDFNPNIVLFDRFMVEEQFSWRVKKVCPEAIRVLDTEDLHFLRKQRKEEISKRKSDFLSDNAKRELACMYRCDLNLMISLKEIDLLTTTYNFPKNLLHYVPLLSEKVNLKATPGFEPRSDFVFVGNFLHEPNWHAAQILKREIWPKLFKKLPKAKLHIYGAYATDKNYQLHSEKERFLVHGYVENINDILQKNRVMIAPLFFGAGQKGKLLKAMQNGLPSVTTSIGAEAMSFDQDWPGIVVDETDKIIDACVNLYSDKVLWKKTQNNITELISKNFSYQKHFKTFQNRIEKLESTISTQRQNNIVGEILWHQSMRSTEFMSRWIMEKNKN